MYRLLVDLNDMIITVYLTIKTNSLTAVTGPENHHKHTMELTALLIKHYMHLILLYNHLH